MVAIEKLSSRNGKRGDEETFFSTRFVSIVASVLIAVLFLLETKALIDDNRKARTLPVATTLFEQTDVKSVTSLRNSNLRLTELQQQKQQEQQRTQDHQQQLTSSEYDDQQCRWYLAESAIPKSGLGLFTGTGLLPGEMIGFPDICIFVGDAPDHWTHLRSHTWGSGTFFGQYEGSNSRAACEGFTTTYNTVPDRLINTEIVSPILPTNAGLHRATTPGAGSITHHYGIHAKAKDVITAGSELTINYGDWDFKKEEVATFKKPERPVEWLEKHGWCIDHLRIGPSTIPGAGRGAFARHSISAGTIVVPMPLQSFRDRSIFQNTEPEQLFTNYCLQPKNSKMIFYPYGPVFNLINHPDVFAPKSSPRAQPNVHLQWSSSNMHHSTWLDLSYDGFWKVTTPGGLILEAVASRDIRPGEEILLDYGQDWESAWKKHVASWKPPSMADSYVYPADIDETEMLRTVKEQQSNPYPDNLMTMCSTPDWHREKMNHIKWYESKQMYWWEGMTYCHILDRFMGENGNYVYTVSLTFSSKPKDLIYNEEVPIEDLYIDREVPRRAIRFLEKPYMDDEHLENAFRHPIEFPANLVPEAWRTNTQ